MLTKYLNSHLLKNTIAKYYNHILSFLRLPITLNHLKNSNDEKLKLIEINNFNLSNIEQVNLENTPIIISLTTYGNRIYDVHYTIKTLLMQTVKVEKIILWLSEDEYEKSELPYNLLFLEKYDFEIRFCKDIKSYKKIIPAIEEYPDYNIITVDDDIFYPNDMVENLVKESIKHPNYIIGYRAHKISFNQNGLNKYTDWEYETSCNDASHSIFLTSGAGTFFPSHIFDELFSNSNIFMELAPTADDVWINFNAYRLNIRRKKVQDNRNWEKRFIEFRAIQSSRLSSLNVGLALNDHQINNVVDFFKLDTKGMK